MNRDITPETYAQVHRYAERADGARSMNESEEALLSDVERLTAEVERLTAERAELLELVGDCDLSQILAQQPRCYCGIERDQHVGERHTFEAYTRPEEEMAREIVRLRAERAALTAERDAIAQALDDDCAPDIDGQQVKTPADRIGALLGHWQDKIRGALCAVVPDPHRIDGGGCDSGDPLDLTLAEVAQAVNQLTDRADEKIAALTAERDAARRAAEGKALLHPEHLLVEVNAERIRRRLSWRELATQLSVAPSTLTRWNNGRLPSIGVFFDAYDWLRAVHAADKATP
jgi:hypothetical protein